MYADVTAEVEKLLERWNTRTEEGHRLSGFAGYVMNEPVVELLERVLDALQAKAPKHFPTKKWLGQGGFGQIGEDRRVIVQKAKGGDVAYVIVMDDSDGVGIGFTRRETHKLIAALQAAVATLDDQRVATRG